MNAPYAVTTVVVNENLKKIVKPKERKHQFSAYFACAALAGTAASIVTCPMDNIKTKLQTQKFHISHQDSVDSKPNTSQTGPGAEQQPSTKPHKPQIPYKNITDTSRKIYNENGFFKGFFRGLAPRILFNAPSCAISWASYEIMKYYLLKVYK